MSTITDILEGKTGNYLKLEDLGEDAFIITESIDPKKTDIRTEKVPNKNKKEGEKDYTEYHHILGKLGDMEKDLSLTFTALKQLAAVMPRDENWRGYPIKFLGKKGSGKNIKYNYQVLGKVTVEQARLPQDAGSPEKAIIDELKGASGFFPDGIIPETNVLQCITKHLNGGSRTAEDELKHLKDKGLIFWIENTTAKGYKVSA